MSDDAASCAKIQALTVLIMQLVHLTPPLPVLHELVVKFVPFGRGCQLGTRKSCNGREEQSVKNKEREVDGRGGQDSGTYVHSSKLSILLIGYICDNGIGNGFGPEEQVLPQLAQSTIEGTRHGYGLDESRRGY